MPHNSKVKSQTRCNIKRDAGLTRADTTGNKYCCLFFARGCCPYGWECEYRHMLPDVSSALPDTSKDCFARDKFADYRDDMGGVGSFQRQNRTLYIGRIKETGTGVETEEVVRRHFKEWGEIEKSTCTCLRVSRDDRSYRCTVRVLQYRSVAFVTYVSELNAQFAKEAMACQSLDNDEILNVRWATEDPNPTSKVEERQRLEQIGREAIQSKMDPRIVDAVRAVRALEDGDVLDDGDVVQDLEESGPPAKRRRLELEDAPQAPAAEPEEEPEEELQPQQTGLLSADALEGLKYFAEIRKRNALANPVVRMAPPPKPPTEGLGLADYGSDDE